MKKTAIIFGIVIGIISFQNFAYAEEFNLAGYNRPTGTAIDFTSGDQQILEWTNSTLGTYNSFSIINTFTSHSPLNLYFTITDVNETTTIATTTNYTNTNWQTIYTSSTPQKLEFLEPFTTFSRFETTCCNNG